MDPISARGRAQPTPDPQSEVNKNAQAAPTSPTAKSSQQIVRASDKKVVSSSVLRVAHGTAIEAARHGVAAYIGWGLAKCWAETLYMQMVGAGYDPASLASNMGKAAFVMPFLAVGHYVGNVVVAPVVQWALRGSVAPVVPQQAFPDAIRKEGESDAAFASRQEDVDASRLKLLKMQALGRPGQIPANAGGDVGFGSASGAQPLLFSGPQAATPWIRSISSFNGGAIMGAGWGLLNMTTKVKGQHTHVVIPAKNLGDMIMTSINKVAVSTSPGGQVTDTKLGKVVNTAHDLLVRAMANGTALAAGAVVQTVVAHDVQAENPGKPLALSPGMQSSHNPVERSVNGAAGSVAALESGYYKIFELASRRGQTPGRPVFDQTWKALKRIDPRASPGSLATLLVGERSGAVAKTVKVALQAVEMPYHSAQALLALPGHVAFDVALGLQRCISKAFGRSQGQVTQTVPDFNQEQRSIASMPIAELPRDNQSQSTVHKPDQEGGG